MKKSRVYFILNPSSMKMSTLYKTDIFVKTKRLSLTHVSYLYSRLTLVFASFSTHFSVKRTKWEDYITLRHDSLIIKIYHLFYKLWPESPESYHVFISNTHVHSLLEGGTLVVGMFHRWSEGVLFMSDT